MKMQGCGWECNKNTLYTSRLTIFVCFVSFLIIFSTGLDPLSSLRDI